MTPHDPVIGQYHGLLMKPYMIPALLRKRDPKWQTRRLVVPYNSTVLGYGVTVNSPLWKALRWRNKTYPPLIDRGPHMLHTEASEYLHVAAAIWDHELVQYRVRSRMSIGDLIYVKEPFTYGRATMDPSGYEILSDVRPGGSRSPIHYRNNGLINEPQFRWLSPLFMPKRYARIWLEVTGIRVERVQSITTGDVIGEGLRLNRYGSWTWLNDEQWRASAQGSADPQSAYAKLFKLINGDAAWNKNPFVWIYEFERVARPSLFCHSERSATKSKNL